jgi:hypothetical protein
MGSYFVLKGKVLVSVSIVEWAKWIDSKQNVICQTQVGALRVSTTCLGFNHGGAGVPLYYETMVFPTEAGERQWRYTTYDQALAGHMAIVYRLQQEADDAQ